MRTYKIGVLPPEEVEYFEFLNKGFKCTGKTLEERYTDAFGFEQSTTYVVMTGKFTPYGMCRDCGDHYTIARWSRYDRIDKDTFEITYDTKDN